MDVRVTLDSQKDSPAEFIDRIARTLAESIVFDNHGPLSEDEQAAFQWGFRYGIDQTQKLLNEAANRDPKLFMLIGQLMQDAMNSWAISAKPSVILWTDLDKPAQSANEVN